MALLSVSLVWLSLLLSGILCGWMLHLSNRFALLDRGGAEAHKELGRDVPNTGGVAIAWSILLPIGALLALGQLPAATALMDPELVAGLREMTPAGVALLAALLIVHAVGLADDRRPLSPWPKLAAQVAAAALVVTLGQTRVLHLLDGAVPGGYALSLLLSALWLIVIINAMNMLDNMDGLSAGVGAIASCVFLTAALLSGQWFVAGAAALLLGALIGFLVFNFPPARLFMGDSGSMALGLMLGVLSIRTTYIPAAEVAAAVSGGGAGEAISGGGGGAFAGYWHGILTPLLVLAIPLYDFTSVVLIRLSQGRSPWIGDRQHFSHRLVQLGLSRRRAVGVIWFAAAATGLGGVVLGRVEPWQAAVIAAAGACVLLMLALLEHGVVKGRASRAG